MFIFEYNEAFRDFGLLGGNFWKTTEELKKDTVVFGWSISLLKHE